MKTMNKVGSIGRSGAGAGKARPTSWSVNAGVSAKKNEQAQALRELQAQIEKDEQAKQPVVVNKPPSRESSQADLQATPWDPHAAETHVGRIKAEEDRLNRWMKKTGQKIDYDESDATQDGASISASPSVLSAGSSQQSTPSVSPRIKDAEPEHVANPTVVASLPKFQELVTSAARHIHRDNATGLVSDLFALVTLAKHIADHLPEDSSVISYARALQGAANLLRTKTDSGNRTVANKTEISDALGNLYLNVLGYS